MFNWYWPLTKPKNAGVYAYDAVSFGQYDGGVQATPIQTKAISDVKSAKVSFTFSYWNQIGEWNGLTEMFLTHLPPTTAAWVRADKQLGTFTDPSGIAWQAVQHPGPEGTFPIHLLLGAGRTRPRERYDRLPRGSPVADRKRTSAAVVDLHRVRGRHYRRWVASHYRPLGRL